MRQKLIDQDIPLAEDRRLVKRLWKVDISEEFPTGLEFAYQYLYFKEKWIQVARIDNQLHKGKPGVHIHIMKREVEWVSLTFEEAETKILELGEHVIKKIIEKV